MPQIISERLPPLNWFVTTPPCEPRPTQYGRFVSGRYVPVRTSKFALLSAPATCVTLVSSFTSSTYTKPAVFWSPPAAQSSPPGQ